MPAVGDGGTPVPPASNSLTAAQPSPPLAKLIEADSRRRSVGALLGWLVELPVVGIWVARATRAPNRIRFASTRMTRLHAWLLRRAGGRLRRSWLFAGGQPIMSLTTTGRRSGRPRTTVVTCFTYGDDLASAGMNLGVSRDPSWVLNLEANSDATIELRGQVIPVTGRRARGAEAERLWQRWVEVQPSAEAFRDVAGRDIPLFVLTRRD